MPLDLPVLSVRKCCMWLSEEIVKDKVGGKLAQWFPAWQSLACVSHSKRPEFHTGSIQTQLSTFSASLSRQQDCVSSPSDEDENTSHSRSLLMVAHARDL